MLPPLTLIAVVVFNLAMFVLNFPIQLAHWPFLPFRWVYPPFYRWYMRVNESVWATMISYLTVTLIPSQFVVTGDGFSPKGNAIVFANHQIYADWWYLWMAAFAQGRQGDVKIVLKHELKNIPLVGWAMQFWEFVFLKRNWVVDKKTLETMLTSFSQGRVPIWLIVFPEGTVHSTERRENASKFSKKSGQKMFKNLLIPRTTGSLVCRKQLTHLDLVYDVTIGYEGTEATLDAESVYTLGRIFHRADPPPRVHMHVRQIPISQVPSDEEGFALWMTDSFKAKDQLLDTFYSKGAFPGQTRSDSVPRPTLLGVLARLGHVFAVDYAIWRGVQYTLALVL